MIVTYSIRIMEINKKLNADYKQSRKKGEVDESMFLRAYDKLNTTQTVIFLRLIHSSIAPMS